MAVVVGRMVAILQAQTAEFEARMAAMGNVVNRFTSTQTVAARATSQLRTGLQGLAQQAIGVTGPLGQLGTGLLSVFGGPAALAVAATAGVIALAIRSIGKAAAEETARIKTLDDAIKSLLHEAGPAVALRDQMGRVTEERSRVAGELGAKRIAIGQATGQDEWQRAGLVKDIEKLSSEFRQLGIQLTLVTAKYRRAVEEESSRELAALFGTANFTMPGIDLGRVPRGNVPGTPVGRDLGGRFDLLTPAEMLRMLQPSPEEAARDKEDRLARLTRGGASVAGDLDQLMRAPGQERLQAQMRQMALINAAAGGLGMLASGGSAAGLLSAGGGVVGLVNPVAGAIVSGLGTILSGLDSREERRHKEQLDALKKIAQDVGLDRVTVVFTGPDGHQIRKTLAELESGDAVERVPTAVGANG